MSDKIDSRIVNVLHELEELSQKIGNLFWNIPRETAEFLFFWVKALSAKRVLEIGTSNGYSGIWLGSAAKENGGELITIESNAERFEIAKQNFEKAGLLPYIKQIRGHAPEVISQVSGGFDFAFFDATKNEHISYLDAVLPKLKTGGLIAVDNINSHREELTGFLEYVKQKEGLLSIQVNIGSGVMLILKEG